MSTTYQDMVSPSFWDGWNQPIIGQEMQGEFFNNPGANILATVDNSFDDSSLRNDWRGLGLGTLRAFRRPDTQISEEYKIANSQFGDEFHNKYAPLASTTLKGRNQKMNEPTRNLRMDYAMRNINNSRPDEQPQGAGYAASEYNPGGNLLAAENTLERHLHNKNEHYIDPTNAYLRLYKPANSRLTQMLTMDVEKNQLRPTRTSLDAEFVNNHDPRQYIKFKNNRNSDVREIVRQEKISGLPYYGAGPPNGQQAYRPTQRVDGFKVPISFTETGSRDIYNRWDQPNSGAGYYGQYLESNDKLERQHDYFLHERGQNLEEELKYSDHFKGKVSSMNIPDPYNIKNTITSIYESI